MFRAGHLPRLILDVEQMVDPGQDLVRFTRIARFGIVELTTGMRAAERCRRSDCEEWWGFSPDHGCRS